MKKLLAGLAFLLFSLPVYSGVILQAAGASTTAGESSGSWLAVNAINQSALSVGYTSGVTDFDTYLGTGPTQEVVVGGTWFSADSVTTGFFDLDLGGTFTIQSIALWNESQGAGQGVNTFALYGDVNSDFSTAVLLGNYAATDGLSTAEVFGFAPTTMSYLRIDILSNHGASCCVGIMEVALEQADFNALYGIDRSNDTLVKVELPSYVSTTVGSLGTNEEFGGLAYDSNTDTMYMSDGRSSNSIFTIDYATGAASLLGVHGIGDVFGLTFDTTNNVLYGSTTNGQLYSFNQIDGSPTLIGATGFNLGGLAYDSLRDRLIAIATGGNEIYELDRTNGSATLLLGGLPNTNDVGLAYDSAGDVFYSLGLDGNLYAYSATDFTATLLTSGLPAIDGLTLIGAVQQIPMADLTISKLDNIDPVIAGTELTYTIHVDNTGDAPAENVVVTDNLPAGLTLVSTSGCAEDPAGNPDCSLGTIASGGSAEFTVTALVDPSVTGLITNNVSVATTSAESSTDNNSATQDTTVVAQADLSITKIDSSDPIVSGGNQVLVYTIEVSNAGPSDATNVLVTDTLPAVAIFQSTSGCQNDPVGVPVCQLGTIAAGASGSYTISVLLQRSGGTIANSASVTSDASDPTADNDSVIETTEVTAIPIPTLNSMGLLMLVLLLSGFAWVGMRRT